MSIELTQVEMVFRNKTQRKRSKVEKVGPVTMRLVIHIEGEGGMNTVDSFVYWSNGKLRNSETGTLDQLIEALEDRKKELK